MVTTTCDFPKAHGAVCKSFLNKLVETLWYIDGHAKSIERESSRKVPDVFLKFSGYNCPEASKHRKRAITNLSEGKLSSLALSLKDIFHCMKFVDDSKAWCDMRIMVLKLSQVLEDYAIYLRAKNQSVKRVHLTPRSEVEKACNVTVLPIWKGSMYYDLVNADIKLASLELYKPMSLSEHLEAGLDRKKLYYIIDGFLLKKGFSVKGVFIWRQAGSVAGLARLARMNFVSYSYGTFSSRQAEMKSLFTSRDQCAGKFIFSRWRPKIFRLLLALLQT